MNYQVIDFIIRIKNASLAKRRKVVLPYSNLNKDIGKLMVENNFLEEIKEETIDGKKILIAQLRFEKRNPVFTDVLIISKPSLSVHVKTDSISKFKRKGIGISVLSTNKGVMTAKEAQKKGIGGEFLFRVW